MNAKISLFLFCVETIYFLLYNLHGCTFNKSNFEPEINNSLFNSNERLISSKHEEIKFLRDVIFTNHSSNLRNLLKRTKLKTIKIITLLLINMTR